VTVVPPIDWHALRAEATDVVRRAYAPYSGYPVGAAALVDDGRVVVGGGGRLVAFTCVDGAGRVIMPCGRCRQLLWEHGGPELLVETVSGVRPMTEVLPDAFGPDDLRRGE
jgi:cytidine deaminase